MSEKTFRVVAWLVGAAGFVFAQAGAIDVGAAALGWRVDYWLAVQAVALLLVAWFSIGVMRGAASDE